MQNIDFFTPVSFNGFNNKLGDSLLETCDALFSFYGDRAIVVSKVDQSSYLVELEPATSSFFETVLKIVCLMTVVIPIVALIGKAILRALYDFRVKEPESGMSIEAPSKEACAEKDDELRIAVLLGKLDEVKSLLSSGKVSKEGRGVAVWGAVCTDSLDATVRLGIVKAILGKGSISDQHRGFAFGNALGRGYLDIMQELLKGGTIKRSDHLYGIINAAEGGHLEAIKEMLKDGDEVSESVLSFAIKQATKNKHKHVVDFLTSLQR